MNNEWITDRRPTREDGTKHHELVYDYKGNIVHYGYVADGEAWKPIPNCEPYVKPQRYGVRENYPGSGKFVVYDTEDGLSCSSYLPTREAAERIAAIYEEVKP